MFVHEEYEVKDEVVILEDIPEQAKTLIKHLKFNENYLSIKYLQNLEELETLLHNNKVNRFYLVDIHLGEGKAEDGIKAIRMIRKNDPKSLIIVYTGFSDTEKQCIDAGADIFFLKDPVHYKSDLKQIKNTITKVMNKEERMDWQSVTKIYSQIVDIDHQKQKVLLNCKLEKGGVDVFKRVFPLKNFRNREYLLVDQCIMIIIFEKEGEVRFIFEDVEENYFEEDEIIDISHLEHSPMFGPLE